MEPEPVTTLPRGHHGLSRAEVCAAQRSRLLVGMVDAVAELGYPATTVAVVLKRARISRQTFYEHFENKEHCFLAAFDASADLFLTRMATALGPAEDPVLLRLDRVFGSWLESLAAAPGPGRAFLIEIYAAGYAAVSRRLERQERFAQLVGEAVAHGGAWRGDLEPRFIGRALVGAASTMVTARIDAGESAHLTELRDPLLAMARALLAS
ncbi:TetR/AcrR family transcriptional regulator [Kitasatospora sp. NPDC006697]|uniref:TetR/AcrR family transcriptional regulator n=1 Tax=Kitasatospora sp. NPDC006697 TaxID=3364020 RepID=UPI0036975F02